jgi:hypothetical protein
MPLVDGELLRVTTTTYVGGAVHEALYESGVADEIGLQGVDRSSDDIVEELELGCPSCGHLWLPGEEVGRLLRVDPELELPPYATEVVLVKVPTLNDGPRDFNGLASLWGQIATAEALSFDFESCRFLRPPAVAFLGGAASLARSRGAEVEFAWDTMPVDVRTNLEQSGFACAQGRESRPWYGNSVPYRGDQQQDPDAILDYLRTRWLRPQWLKLSEPLIDRILSNVWEIYANAFEHSGSPVGVHTCGQYFRRLGMVELTVIDFGQGIPSKVEGFLRRPISPGEAMAWAFAGGNSTASTTTIPRGLGLDLLSRFVVSNRGKLEIYSQNGYAGVSEGGALYQTLAWSLPATAVNIWLQCDERCYDLGEEPSTVVF